MDLEIIIVRKVSQKEKDKSYRIDIENRLVAVGQGGEGMDWEFGKEYICICEKEYIYVCITDSLCCTAEINTAL